MIKVYAKMDCEVVTITRNTGDSVDSNSVATG